jgi:hypothetical protein
VSQQINLFNPVFLKQKKYFSAVTMAQALGLIMLGAGAMALYANMQLAGLRPQADAVTAQLEAAKAQLALVNAGHGARKKDDVLDAKVRRTEANVVALQRVTTMLRQGEIGNARGYSDYMRAFSRQIVDGVWLTGFSIGAGGSDIALAGRALRPELVPAYLSRLSSEPTMRGRAFGVMEMQTPEAVPGSAPGTQTDSVVFRLQSERVTGTADGAGVQ